MKTNICPDTIESSPEDGQTDNNAPLEGASSDCQCPEQIVTCKHNMAIFTNLELAEAYFPMVSRANTPVAFYGLPPDALTPTPPQANSLLGSLLDQFPLIHAMRENDFAQDTNSHDSNDNNNTNNHDSDNDNNMNNYDSDDDNDSPSPDQPSNTSSPTRSSSSSLPDSNSNLVTSSNLKVSLVLIPPHKANH